jgi:hypothetical protein
LDRNQRCQRGTLSIELTAATKASNIAQAWDKLFPSYDDCLKQASTLEMQNAVLKDRKTVEVPGEGPPKEDVLLTPEASVLEEPDQADAAAQPPQKD